MYSTMRKKYYLPGLPIACYNAVRNCAPYARERIKLQQNAAQLTLFPAKAPLEDVAMDILGELLPNLRGIKFLLVMVDRFTKLVRTVPLKRITAWKSRARSRRTGRSPMMYLIRS